MDSRLTSTLHISRREFIATTSALSVTALVSHAGRTALGSTCSSLDELINEDLLHVGLEPVFSVPSSCRLLHDWEIPSSPPNLGQLIHRRQYRVRRAADVLNLKVELRGGRLMEWRRRLYLFADTVSPARLVVEFPPQHVVEPAVGASSIECGKQGTEITQVPLANACLGARSRLVFEIPPGERMLVDLDRLLHWEAMQLLVAPVAIPTLGLKRPDETVIGPPTSANLEPREPKADESAIVLPYGLLISPHVYTKWDHNLGVAQATRAGDGHLTTKPIELWETRAVVDPAFAKENPGAAEDSLKTVRAIWSHGHSTPESCPCDIADDKMLPIAKHREDIVNLSAGFHLKQLIPGGGHKAYEPPAIACPDLRLAPHGGSIRAKGKWDPESVVLPNGAHPQVTKYDQQTRQGRDQFVRVQTVYYGCPIPVKIVLIQQRQREFIPVQSEATGRTGTGAAIVERWYSRHIPMGPFESIKDGDSVIGRRWPFEVVEFNWPDATELRKPVDVLTNKESSLPDACWMIPKCESEPLPIEVRVRDRQGLTQTFKIPLLLVELNVALGAKPDMHATLRRILDLYCTNHPWPGLGKTSYRDTVLAGQRIGVVPRSVPASVAANPKDNENRGSLVTGSLSFGVETIDPSWTSACFPTPAPDGEAPKQFTKSWQNTRLQYYPAVAKFNVRLREVEAYSKSPGSATTEVGWNHKFNFNGFAEETNRGELFLDVVGEVPGLDFGGDKGGGLATPSLDITNLSRKIGTVGGGGARRVAARAASTQPFQDGTFDPKSFFGGTFNAKLIGDITLSDLLQVINASEGLDAIPKLVPEELTDINGAVAQLASLAAEVDRVLRVVNAVPAGLIRDLQALSNLAKQGLENLLNELLVSVTKQFVDEITAVKDAQGKFNSAVTTFEVLLAAVRRQYANATSEQLLNLAASLSVDTLVRVVGEPLAAARNALAAFIPVDPLAPWRRIVKLLETLKDPAELISGSVLEQIDALLNDLSVGHRLVDGRRADLAGIEEQIKKFLDSLKAALDRAVTDVRTASDAIDTKISEALAPFPNATGMAEQAARARLEHYKQYLKQLEADWKAQADKVAKDLKQFIDTYVSNIAAQLTDLLGQLTRQYDVIRRELGAAIQFIRDLLAQIPKSISFTYAWETELQNGPAGFPIFVANNRSQTRRAKLVLKSRIEKKLGLSETALRAAPTVDASVSLTDFQIVLIPDSQFVMVGFKRLSLESKGLQKPVVTTEIEGIEFGDCLSFVQALAQIFSSGSGFYADINFLGILAGYRFAVPAFSLGAFNIADLALGVHFTLPFDGSPIGLGLQVSERSRPCLLSVAIYGGTAFFGLELSPRSDQSSSSVRMLEAALEFGAVANASIGVAHGRLYVFGGIYFGRRGQVVQLTGFVRAGGSLDVLSLIVVSVEFYLGLTYQSNGNETQVYGEARVTVHVKIIFVINVRVTLQYIKYFKGSESRLTYHARAIVPQQSDVHLPIDHFEWLEYSNQFA